MKELRCDEFHSGPNIYPMLSLRGGNDEAVSHLRQHNVLAVSLWRARLPRTGDRLYSSSLFDLDYKGFRTQEKKGIPTIFKNTKHFHLLKFIIYIGKPISFGVTSLFELYAKKLAIFCLFFLCSICYCQYFNLVVKKP